MEATSIFAVRKQLNQADLGVIMLRTQPQARQTLAKVPTQSTQAVAPANPVHQGQHIHTQA